MIDLNTKITPSEPINESREVIPAGTYTLKVIKIEPWKAQPAKTIQVAERDERGYVVKDDTGKVIRNTVKDVVLYSTNITLEVQYGEYRGRRVFHRFDTHPDFSFLISHFTYACDVGEPILAELPTVCLNKVVEGVVEHQTYNKKVVDKNTGIEDIIPTTVARITKFTRSLGI